MKSVPAWKPSPNRPATIAEALDLLRRSLIPQLRVETLRDLLAGRPGHVVRREPRGPTA